VEHGEPAHGVPKRGVPRARSGDVEEQGAGLEGEAGASSASAAPAASSAPYCATRIMLERAGTVTLGP
jgi:hypothetical protein